MLVWFFHLILFFSNLENWERDGWNNLHHGYSNDYYKPP
jgi:hypothetical protein